MEIAIISYDERRTVSKNRLSYIFYRRLVASAATDIGIRQNRMFVQPAWEIPLFGRDRAYYYI